MELVNWKLISHPVNWGIVWVTLLLAAAAYAFVHDGLTRTAITISPD